MNMYFGDDRVDVHVQGGLPGTSYFVLRGIFHEENERGIVLRRTDDAGHETDSYAFVPWHALLAVVARTEEEGGNA
jgi:hypothetical protein